LKQYDDALSDFDRARAIDADFVWAIGLRGHLRRLLGRPVEAQADLERSVQLDADGWGHYQLGLLTHVQRRPETAKERFRTAIRAESSDMASGDTSGSALLNIVIYHVALGEVDEARVRLRTALAADPMAGNLRDALDDLEDLGSVMALPEIPEFMAALRAKLHE
jgi:tetratricopeptide (TPR) repeat protein